MVLIYLQCTVCKLCKHGKVDSLVTPCHTYRLDPLLSVYFYYQWPINTESDKFDLVMPGWVVFLDNLGLCVFIFFTKIGLPQNVR